MHRLGRRVLAVLQLDAVSVPLVERLIDEGRLPALAELVAAGWRTQLESTAEYLPAAAYPTLYSGLPPRDHGLYYPFQWSPDEQRVRFRKNFQSPPAIWERLAAAGRRSLVLDPYDVWRPRRLHGEAVCGWQFRNPVSLESWSAPAPLHSSLRRRLGRPRYANEVFGRITRSYALHFLETLLAAPGRVAALAEDRLRAQSYDLVWVNFLSPHLGGHMFWDVESLAGEDAADMSTREALDSALVELYEATDRGLARVLAALPDEADLLVLSPMGMGVNLSRVDFLPEMLERVLSPNGHRGMRRSTSESVLWRLRAAVPTRARATVARALGGPIMRGLTTRMSSLAVDWSQTPAFMLPSDHFGQVRLNIRGREREGIVGPGEVDDLSARIVDGLRSFEDPDGQPAVDSVVRIADVAGDGPFTHLLPDLVVRWPSRSAVNLPLVRSERFGEVVRRGAGTGRTGAHTPDAWLLVCPRRSRPRDLGRAPRLEDVAATACGLWEIEAGGLGGEPLLE